MQWRCISLEVKTCMKMFTSRDNFTYKSQFTNHELLNNFIMSSVALWSFVKSYHLDV